MIEGEDSPLGARSPVELVAELIGEVDCQSEQDRAVLLSDLLCAAWPTDGCQDH